MKHVKRKVNKSDLLNSNVWCDAIDYCGYFLMRIINESIQTGYFPQAWKLSTVTPIPKVIITRNANEFRAINTMPVDEKIAELIIKEQLVKFVENNSKLASHQSAFRAKHSCETTINYIINDWKVALENGEIVVVVSLDLRRAFETIDREKMIESLLEIGVSGRELEWFTNFLSDRRQQTKYNGCMSNEIEVPIGLPQGTALSVILFIIYINNVTKLDLNGNVILFADDTMLIVKSIEVNAERCDTKSK